MQDEEDRLDLNPDIGREDYSYIINSFNQYLDVG